MKYIIPALFTLLLAFAACNNPTAEVKVTTDTADSTVVVDTQSTATPAPPMDSAAMAKAWEAFMTPGEMHTWMASQVGTWNVDVKSWMDPNQPPAESKATNVVTMALNNLYQLSHYKGEMMGMPFEGRGTLAYDNARKMFVSTWIDNLGSGIMMMTGTYNESTKMLSLKGTQTDPMTGKESPIREDYKIIDDNTQTFELYGPGMDGKEMKYMEATMKRKM